LCDSIEVVSTGYSSRYKWPHFIPKWAVNRTRLSRGCASDATNPRVKIPYESRQSKGCISKSEAYRRTPKPIRTRGRVLARRMVFARLSERCRQHADQLVHRLSRRFGCPSRCPMERCSASRFRTRATRLIVFRPPSRLDPISFVFQEGAMPQRLRATRRAAQLHPVRRPGFAAQPHGLASGAGSPGGFLRVWEMLGLYRHRIGSQDCRPALVALPRLTFPSRQRPRTDLRGRIGRRRNGRSR
jgi:hypothetical protein